MAKIDANAYYNAAVRRPAGPGSHSSTRSRSRCSWPASGRTSRPAGTAPNWSQHFTGTKEKWFTFTNGAHIDSLDPATFDRWYDFLELFVAHQAPIVNSARHRAAAPSSTRRPWDSRHGPDHAAARPDPGDPDVQGRA